MAMNMRACFVDGWRCAVRSIVSGAFILTTISANAAELTFNNWLPAKHPLVVNGLIPWAEDIAKESNGALKINFLPAPVSSPAQAYDSVREGLADLTFVVHSYTPGRFPLSLMAEFPFLGNSAEANSCAYQKAWERDLSAASDIPGVKVLANFTHGPGQMFTVNRPIAKPEDAKGLKIRTGGGISLDVVESLGAAPVTKSATESYEILSTGIADGIFFPLESTTAFNLQELLKYATIFDGGLYNVSFGVIMNQDAYDRLTEAEKVVFDKLDGVELACRLGRVWDDADRNAKEVLVENGVTFLEPDPELVAAIRAGIEPSIEKWMDDARKAGLDPEAVLRAFQDDIKSYKK